MSTELERRFPGPIRGQILFAVAFFAISALLLSQIGQQTAWAKGTKLFAQPRFWPAVSLGGMVLFGALHWAHMPRRRVTRDDRQESWRWLTTFEWVGWFLVYVFAVPVIGYLPVTIAFSVGMCWRLGYRSTRWYWTAAAFACVVVVLFKGFLSVRIPGAAAYEYLPGTMRTFFILYF